MAKRWCSRLLLGLLAALCLSVCPRAVSTTVRVGVSADLPPV